MTIKLIDTYSNGEFDIPKWKAAGVSGVFLRAGQGNWSDCIKLHPEWWAQLKDAGIARGWYWVCDSRTQSSDHIVEMEKRKLFDDVGELGIFADVEKPYIAMKDGDYWQTRYAGWRNVVDFVYLMSLRTQKVGVYTGAGAFKLCCSGIPKEKADWLAQFPLWVAQYPALYIPNVSKPTLFGSWKTWRYWQYRDGNNDLFSGTDSEFAALIGAQTQPEPPTDPIPQPIPQPATKKLVSFTLNYNDNTSENYTCTQN